jgi:hypothetical protein
MTPDRARARYLRLMDWARARYQDADGSLTISEDGRLSRYSLIERAAYRRYVAPAMTAYSAARAKYGF